MSYETIRYEVDADGVLMLTLSRPDKLNSFTVTMANELIDAYTRANTDDSVRVIVVTGAGRAFCAGMDLSAEGNVFGLDETLTPTLEDLRERGDDPKFLHGVRDTGGRVAMAMFGDGFSLRFGGGAFRFRVRQTWHHAGGVFVLVPAAHCGARTGAGMELPRQYL